MGCTLFWVKFGHAFAYFVVSCFTSQMALLFNINIKTEYILIAKSNCSLYIFTQESFYLQGILNDRNEQDSSFLTIYKHMMKSGAPPDKFGVMPCSL